MTDMTDTTSNAIQVLKRDGNQEPFSRAKVESSVVKAGGTQEDAEKVATALDTWAKQAGAAGPIASSDIRIKVIEQLQATNPSVAIAFEEYKKEEKAA